MTRWPVWATALALVVIAIVIATASLFLFGSVGSSPEQWPNQVMAIWAVLMFVGVLVIVSAIMAWYLRLGAVPGPLRGHLLLPWKSPAQGSQRGATESIRILFPPEVGLLRGTVVAVAVVLIGAVHLILVVPLQVLLWLRLSSTSPWGLSEYLILAETVFLIGWVAYVLVRSRRPMVDKGP